MSAVMSNLHAEALLASGQSDRRSSGNGGYPQQMGPGGGYPAGQPVGSGYALVADVAPIRSALRPASNGASGPLVVTGSESRLQPPSPGRESVHSSVGPGMGSMAPASGPVLRKKLFDQNVSDWASRYRKNKQSLDTITRDCELLRAEVAKQQAEVDLRVEKFQQLEDRFQNEAVAKFSETKAALQVSSQQKAQLTVDLSENRKLKAQLLKEKKLLMADYERKHAELARGAEMRDRLESQLGIFTTSLHQVSSERQRLERELDLVQHNLRQHTELADEAHNEMERTCHGIKDSVDHHMAPSLRLEASFGSHEAVALEEQMMR